MADHNEEQAKLAHEARLARAQKLIEQFTRVADTSKRPATKPRE